jgi:hypothetical protein
VPRNPRNYKEEYARRIARGLAAGKTRAQARGHGADVKRAAPQVVKLSAIKSIPGRLRGLRPDRSVRIMATHESGMVSRIGEGKAGRLREWIEERIEDDENFAMIGPSTVDVVVSIQIFYI